MELEKRTICYDQILHIEAYQFEGIMQRFPNHFHEHYVFGFVEHGSRHLTCKNKEYTIRPGDFVLFHPLDNHACEQIDEEPLDWRCLNIEKPVMCQVLEELSGYSCLPAFKENVVHNCELVPVLKELHGMVIRGKTDLKKEELFYFFMEQLLSEYGEAAAQAPFPVAKELQAACNYMELNYMNTITLDDLTKVSGMKKFTFLRAFSDWRGISPYQYVSAIRVNKAKQLLEAGSGLTDTATQTGFSDQSHFTRFFKSFIGVTPGVYQKMYEKESNR